MSSATTTTNLGLPQWASDEKPERADFNDAFDAIDGILNLVYPVGSIYISVNSTNPGTLFGGTWTAFGAGKTLVGIDSGDADFDTVEETGGAKTHTLTTAEIPASNLKQAVAATTGTPGYFPVVSMTTNYGPGRLQVDGGNGEHNNLQPYIVTYMWKRTA